MVGAVYAGARSRSSDETRGGGLAGGGEGW